MHDAMLAGYLKRHHRGELSEQDVARLIAELRRLREELKVSQHELLQVRRRHAAIKDRYTLQAAGRSSAL